MVILLLNVRFPITPRLLSELAVGKCTSTYIKKGRLHYNDIELKKN